MSDGDPDTEQDEGDEATTDASGERFDLDRRRGREGEAEPRGPLSGLRADIEERRKERESEAPAVEDVFEKTAEEPMLDGEQIWEDLLESQDAEAAPFALGEAVEGEAADVRVIESRICHSCKWFGEPPELHCTHDGTTIRRMVDMDHYEVEECPVVKNRSDLHGDAD